MVRAFTLFVRVSIALVLAINTAHAEPRISALVLRANDDIAHNSHGWALERDADRIVLMSPRKVSLLTRMDDKLRETGEPLVANELFFWTIGNLGDSQFWVPGYTDAGMFVAVYEVKRAPTPRWERLKEFGFSRNFRIANGLPHGSGSIILSLPSGPLVAMRRVNELSSFQWNSKMQTIESGGKTWEGDQKWHAYPIPRLTAVCGLGEGEALVASQGMDATATAHLTVFQAFPDTLKPLNVTPERLNDPQVRNGIISARQLASSRDGKLVVGCGGEQATLFECNEKKELIHLGLYCAAADKPDHGWATGIVGLVKPRLCAAGDTWDKIAIVDGFGSVSLCRYDSTTKGLIVVKTVDLGKLLSDKPGNPIAVTFAGRYLRIATTRYALIELDFEMR